MSQDKPTQLPEWASNPGAPPPTAITEPIGEKTTGWLPGFARRTYDNWFKNLVFQWVAWLTSSVMRWLHLGPDHALPDEGSPPSTGVGLGPVGAADFAAAIIVDGYRIGPVDGPGFTYPANSDTYWDLGRDCVWDASSVANAAPEPPLSANHIRVYKVMTDATDRTSVEDRRSTHTRFSRKLDFEDEIRLGEGNNGSDVDAAKARRVVRYRDPGGPGYTLIDEFRPITGGQITCYLYMRHADRQRVLVRGARWNGVDWDFEGTTFAQYMEIDNLVGGNRSLAITTPPAPDPFPDADWFADLTAAGANVKVHTMGGTLQAGQDLNNNAFERTRTPRFRTSGVTTTPGQGRTYANDGDRSNRYILGNTDGGTDASGNGVEEAANCEFDESTGFWSFKDATTDAFKLEVSSVGLRLLVHRTTEGATWSDTVNAGTDWSILIDFEANPVATVPVRNSLMAKNLPKAWATVDFGGGAPSLVDGFNVASVASQGDNLLVTFASPMANGDYTVLVTDQEIKDASPIDKLFGVTAKAAGTFELGAVIASTPVSLNLSSPNGQLGFVVFGEQ